MGVSPNGPVITSADGQDWNQGAVPNLTFPANPAIPTDGVSFANNVFYVLASNGGARTPSDGVDFRWFGWPANASVHEIAYGNDVFVTVGDSGTIVTSTDGITWSPAGWPAASRVNDFSYGNDLYVVIYDRGGFPANLSAARSLSTWTPWVGQDTGTTRDLSAVTYGNGQFMAVGDSGVIVTSADGTNWTVQIWHKPYRIPHLPGLTPIELSLVSFLIIPKPNLNPLRIDRD